MSTQFPALSLHTPLSRNTCPHGFLEALNPSSANGQHFTTLERGLTGCIIWSRSLARMWSCFFCSYNQRMEVGVSSQNHT